MHRLPLRRAATGSLVGLTFAILALAGAPAAGAEDLLGPVVDIPTSFEPGNVIVRDLNGDHRPDIVTVDGSANAVAISLSTGGGHFADPVEYAAGTEPNDVAIADVNDDQRHDLVVSDGGATTVSVLLGTGQGTFKAAKTFNVGARPSSVAIGDFDDDGHRDVATTNTGAQNLSVLLGHGDGTFGSPSHVAASHNPTSLVAGALNGDHRADLAFSTHAGVKVLLAAPGGGFGPATEYARGGLRAGPVTAGDVDGDGDLDLLTSYVGGIIGDEGPWGVLIYDNDGDGAFGPGALHGDGCCGEPLAIAVGDVNGDGHPDVAIAHTDDVHEGFSILRGYGDGQTEDGGCCTGGVEFQSPGYPLSLAIGDLDQSSGPDVVLTHGQRDGMGLFFNTGIVEQAAAGIGPAPTFEDRFVDAVSPGEPVTLTSVGVHFPVRVGSVSLSGPDADQFTLTDDSCSGQTVSGTCSMMVHFAPTSAGTKTATVDIPDDAPGAPHHVVLHATGLAPTLAFPPSRDLGAHLVGTTTTKHGLVTITNASSHPARVTRVKLGGADASQFSISGNTCTTPLAPGDHCTFTARFSPMSVGPKSATVEIDTDSGDIPRFMSLSATGKTDGPVAQVRASFDFGDVLIGKTAHQKVHLANVGDAPLHVTGFTIVGQNPGQFGVEPGQCTGPIEPGHSCIFSPVFKPTVARPLSAGLRIADDARGSPQRMALSGTGLLAPDLPLAGPAAP